MFWAIWYHLYNLKNVQDTYGGVLLFVKLQAKLCSNIALSDFQITTGCCNICLL